MSGWLRAVLRELRHGACVLGFVVLAVLVGVLLWSKGSEWGTRWNELGRLMREFMILIGPVCVTLGVWQGGRGRRSDVAELLATTRRSVLARATSEVAALSSACYAGVLVGAASAAWSIVVVGGWGTRAAPLVLLSLLPGVVAFTALGYAAGRLLSWRIAAPVAGVLTYLVLGFEVWNDDKAAIATGGGWLGGSAGFALDTDALVWSSLGLLIAGVALVAVAAAEWRPARAVAWLPVAAVAGVGTIVVWPITVAAADSSGRLEQHAVPMVCTSDDGPKVCVTREDQHLLDGVVGPARAALARFHDIAGAPTWAGATAGFVPGHYPPDMLEVDPGQTTPWGHLNTTDWAEAQIDSWGYFSLDRFCETDEFGDLPGGPDDAVNARLGIVTSWLSQEHADASAVGSEPESGAMSWDPFDHLEEQYGAIATRFLASSDAQRRDFAGRLIAAVRACDPGAVLAADAALAP